VRRGGLVVLGDSELGGGGAAGGAESGGDPLVASTSKARSPLPPGAVVKDGCAVGDAAAVAASGVPIDGVDASLPTFATVPTPGFTTELASAGPASEPTPKPAEASPAPEPVPSPVPTPATLGAEGSEVFERLVRFESFAPCITVGAALDAGSGSRAGAGPEVRAEAEPEGEAGSEAASEGGVKSEAEAEAPAGVEDGGEVATCADPDGSELEAPSASVAWSAAAGAAGPEAA
jgi:hypothetical protein